MTDRSKPDIVCTIDDVPPKPEAEILNTPHTQDLYAIIELEGHRGTVHDIYCPTPWFSNHEGKFRTLSKMAAIRYILDTERLSRFERLIFTREFTNLAVNLAWNMGLEAAGQQILNAREVGRQHMMQALKGIFAPDEPEEKIH